VVQDPSRLCQS